MQQSDVDQVFRACMARDARTLQEITAAVKRECRRREMDDPTDYDVRVQVSRVASRVDRETGRRLYYPSYTTPPRFVSLERAQELLDAVERGDATPDQLATLKGILGDVNNGIRHWERKESRARRERQALKDIRRRAARTSEQELFV